MNPNSQTVPLEPTPTMQQAGVACLRNEYWKGTDYAHVCEIYRIMLAAAPQPAGPDDVAKDAARYRWWQERYFGDDAAMDEINDAFRNMIGFTKPEVDAAIDAVLYATSDDGK